MLVSELETGRQVLVGNSAANALAVNRPTPLTDTTIARAEAVVDATKAVSLFVGVRPAQVDRATDKVVIGFERVLVHGEERALHDAVVPQGDAQRVMAAQLRQVRARVFPKGTDFTRATMDVEWSALVALRGRMLEPEVAAAIDALGLRPIADHVLAHIELYGRILGEEGGNASAGEEQANAAWTAAFTMFAAQVLVDYQNDAAIRDELLGPYHAQLAQQRAVARAAKKRAAQGEAEEEPAPTGGPTGEPPAVG